MRFLTRLIGILVLLALLMNPALAQDDGTRVVGSGIVDPLFRALVEASGTGAAVDQTVTGTNTGFERFCAGEADIATATRTISADENTNCINNNVTYVELIIGQDIAAFIANPELDFLQCLSGANLNTIFAPSSVNEITSWQQVIEEAPETPLSVFVPGELSSTFAILDDVVEGAGIREDATTGADPADIIASVSETEGAIGVVPLTAAQASDLSFRILEVEAGAIEGCYAPDPVNVEDGLYPAANQLYLYVNIASLAQPGLAELLSFMTSAEAAETVTAQGFTPPTETSVNANIEILTAAAAGEAITRTTDEFVAPTNLTGQVSVGGAANTFGLLNATVTGFSTLNPNVTVNFDMLGQTAGFRQLCNGEIDIASATSPLPDTVAADCSTNNIGTFEIELGPQAVVLVANDASDYLACLTTEQLVTIWGAPATDNIATWDQVDADFPAEEMFLFAPATGNPNTDLLLTTANGASLANRIDTQINADPLYRAAATANVAGGLTYMSWYEYQNVLNNNQQNIQLVAIDNGSGCITPDLDTILDSSYPLTQDASLLLNESSLALPEVQAFVWYLVSNENFAAFQANGFIGMRLSDFEDLRETLQGLFAEAEAAAAAAAAEATPEVAPEATEEATAEAEG